MKIKVKLLLLIISTLSLVFICTMIYTQRFVEKNFEAGIRDEASKIVRQIDSNVSADKGLANVETLNENFDEMMYLSTHIARIDVFVFGDGGRLKPFFTRQNLFGAESKGVAPKALTPDDIDAVRAGRIVLDSEEVAGVNYVDVIAPVRLKGGIIGLTEVKISRTEFDRLSASKRLTTLIIAGIAIAAITAVLIIALNHMVNSPLEKLLYAISKVKSGDLSVRVAPQAQDEIGRLTENFNGMIDTIRRDADERRALLERINRYNDELQARVEGATAELVMRNDELSRANQSIYKIQKKLGHFRRLAAVGQLSAAVAHELGTPLHSISGHLQLLMDEPGLSADINRRLAIMQSQTERVIKSIQDILDTTRLPDEQNDMVDVNMLIDDIVILVMPETISRRVAVEKCFDTGLPPVCGSPSRIQEVFLNLIDNAIDACCEGGAVTITTASCPPPPSARLASEDPALARWVSVSIKDNGRGIPRGQIKEIFEPFYTTKSHGHGTGLGLSISQEIVRKYRGFIAVESEPGKGSVFTVYLPLATEPLKA